MSQLLFSETEYNLRESKTRRETPPLCLTSFFAMVFVGGGTLFSLLFFTHYFDSLDDYLNLALGLTIIGGIGYVVSLVVFNITLKPSKAANETMEGNNSIKTKSRLVQASEYAAKNELSVDTVITMIRNEELGGEKKGNTWYVVPKSEAKETKSLKTRSG